MKEDAKKTARQEEKRNAKKKLSNALRKNLLRRKGTTLEQSVNNSKNHLNTALTNNP